MVCSTFLESGCGKYILGLQGLLSTTYQVEVTFSVKGGAEEQKSIFVKVLKQDIFWFHEYHKNHMFKEQKSLFVNVLKLNKLNIIQMLNLKVPLTGSKAQDYKEVTLFNWFENPIKIPFLDPAPIYGLF